MKMGNNKIMKSFINYVIREYEGEGVLNDISCTLVLPCSERVEARLNHSFNHCQDLKNTKKCC